MENVRKLITYQNVDQLIANVGTLNRIGEYDKAEKLLGEYSVHFPDDYRIWWMQFVSRTRNLGTLPEYGDDKLLLKAFAVAKKEEKNIILELLNQYLEPHISENENRIEELNTEITCEIDKYDEDERKSSIISGGIGIALLFALCIISATGFIGTFGLVVLWFFLGTFSVMLLVCATMQTERIPDSVSKLKDKLIIEEGKKRKIESVLQIISDQKFN